MENKKVVSNIVASNVITEYLGYLTAVRGVSERTVSAYSRDLRSFTSYCDNRDLLPEKAAPSQVRGFIADLSA